MIELHTWMARYLVHLSCLDPSDVVGITNLILQSGGPRLPTSVWLA